MTITWRAWIPAFLLLLSAYPDARAADGAMKVLAASEYPAKQSQAGLTAAVKPYHTADGMKEAFNKVEPYKYGILPILLVVTNDGGEAIDLSNLEVRYIPKGGNQGIEAIPAEDLAYFNPKGHQPRDRNPITRNIPGLARPKVKKGPLAKSEITTSGFSAPVATPKSTSSGFFFYDVGAARDPLAGATIYISGMKNLSTGQELFYFEIPLDSYR